MDMRGAGRPTMMHFMPLGFFGGTLGGGEIILILLVALLLFGAKNLPRIARDLGRSLEQFRRAARDIKDEVMKVDVDEEGAPPAKPPPPPLAPKPDERNEPRS